MKLVFFGLFVLLSIAVAITPVTHGVQSMTITPGIGKTVYEYQITTATALEFMFDNDISTDYPFSVSLSPNTDCSLPIWVSGHAADEHIITLEKVDVEGYMQRYPDHKIRICLTSTASVDVKVNSLIFDGEWLHDSEKKSVNITNTGTARFIIPQCSTDSSIDVTFTAVRDDVNNNENSEVTFAIKKEIDADCTATPDKCIHSQSESFQNLPADGTYVYTIPKTETLLGQVLFAEIDGKVSMQVSTTYSLNMDTVWNTGANTLKLAQLDHCYYLAKFEYAAIADHYSYGGLYTEVAKHGEEMNVADVVVSTTFPPYRAMATDIISACTLGSCELDFTDIQDGDTFYVSIALAGQRSWLHLVNEAGPPVELETVAVLADHSTPVSLNDFTGYLIGNKRGVGANLQTVKSLYAGSDLSKFKPIFVAEVNPLNYEHQVQDLMTAVYVDENLAIQSFSTNDNDKLCGSILDNGAYFYCHGLPQYTTLMDHFWADVAITGDKVKTRFMLGYSVQMTYSADDKAYTWDSTFIDSENFFVSIDLTEFRNNNHNADDMFISAHSFNFLNSAVDIDIFADFKDPAAFHDPSFVSIGDGSRKNTLIIPGLSWNNKANSHLYIRLKGVQMTLTDIVVTTGAATISLDDGTATHRTIGKDKLGFLVSPSSDNRTATHANFAIRPYDADALAAFPDDVRIKVYHSENDGYVDYLTKENHHASITVPVDILGQVERFHVEVVNCTDCDDLLNEDGLDLMIRSTYFTPFADSMNDMVWNPPLHHLKSALNVVVNRFNLPMPSDGRIEVSFPKELPASSIMTVYACFNDVVVSLDSTGTNLAGDTCMKTVIPAEQSTPGTVHNISISATHHNVRFGHWYLTVFLTGSTTTIDSQSVAAPAIRIMTSRHMTLGAFNSFTLSHSIPLYMETHGLGGFGVNTGEQMGSVLMKVTEPNFKPATQTAEVQLCVSTKVFHPDFSKPENCDIMNKTIDLPANHSDAADWEVPPLGARYHVALRLASNNPVNNSDKMQVDVAIANRRIFKEFPAIGRVTTNVSVCEPDQRVYIESILPESAKEHGAFVIAEPVADVNSTDFLKWYADMSVSSGDHLYPDPHDGHVAMQMGGTLSVPVGPDTITDAPNGNKIQVLLSGTASLKGKNNCAEYSVYIYPNAEQIRDIMGYGQHRLNYQNIDIFSTTSFMVTTPPDIQDTEGDFDVVISPCRGSITVGLDYRPFLTFDDVMMPIFLTDHRYEVSFGLKETITQYGKGDNNQVLPRFSYFIDVNTAHVPVGSNYYYSFEAMIAASQYRPYITDFDAEPKPTISTMKNGDLKVCFEAMVVDSPNVDNQEIEYAAYIVDSSTKILGSDPLGWNVDVACGLQGAGVQVTDFRTWKDISNGEEIKVGSTGCVMVPAASIPKNSRMWVNVVSKIVAPYPIDTDFTNAYKAVYYDPSVANKTFGNVGGHYVLKITLLVIAILVATYFFLEHRRSKTPGYQSLSGTDKKGQNAPTTGTHKPLNIGPRASGSGDQASSVLLNSGSLV